MNKEEVLAKVKEAGFDEREKHISIQSSSLGGISVTVVIGIFIIVNAVKGQGSSDLFSILLAYWSVQYFYQYRQLQKKLFLGLGILTSVGFIAAVASYFIWG